MREPKIPPKAWPEFVGNERRKWLRASLRFEWICEHLAYRLSRWAFIELLEYGGKLAVLVTIGLYLFKSDQRKQTAQDQKRAKQFQAWQTLNSSYGKSGNAGRNIALEELARDRVSMVSIDLSNAIMNHISLPFADFRRGNLQGASLNYSTINNACFKDATVHGAEFSHAQLTNSSFIEAKMNGVNFVFSKLDRINFVSADAQRARFSYAELSGVRFDDADLRNAHFTKAALNNTSFAFADLREAVFYDVTNYARCSWQGANIHNIQVHSKKLAEWATNHGAVTIANDKEWISYRKRYSGTNSSSFIDNDCCFLLETNKK
jgi:uncharacterized protein YjbI with pentapeptide repeats